MNRRNFLKQLAGLTVAGAVAGKLPLVEPPADDAIGVVRNSGFYYLENSPSVSGSGEYFYSNFFIERNGIRTYYNSARAAYSAAQAGDTITIRCETPFGERVYGGEDIDL